MLIHKKAWINSDTRLSQYSICQSQAGYHRDKFAGRCAALSNSKSTATFPSVKQQQTKTEVPMQGNDKYIGSLEIFLYRTVLDLISSTSGKTWRDYIQA